MKVNKLFLLAMGLVAVGCNESQIEEQSLINDAQGEAIEVVINAAVNPASRAVTDLEDHTNDLGQTATTVSTEFVVTDSIGVYFNWAPSKDLGFTHENVKFTATAETETGVEYTTKEPLMLLANGNNVYAYYPYEATETGFEGTTRSANLGNWDGYHHFEIPAVQEQTGIADYEGFSKYVKLISKEQQIEKVGNKAKVNMVFEHAFSYATLVVTNTYDRDLNIKEVLVTFFDKEGNAVPVAGDFAAKLDDEAAGVAVVAGENVETTVKLVPAEGADFVLAAEEQTKLIAAIAPFEEALGGAEIVVRTVDGFSYKIVKDYSTRTLTLPQGWNTRFGVELSDATLSSEVVNSEVAEYLLDMDKEHIVLDVAANIELAIDPTSEDAWGGPSTKTITINGGADGLATNRTISFNMSEQTWSDVDLKNPDATLYINNLKLQTTGWDPNSKAGYSRTDLMFNCKVDLEKVISLSAIRAYRSFNANTLVVYDLKAGSSTNNYALWLAPTVEEQIVNINGFQAVSMTAKGERGIKIDATTDYAKIDKSGLGPQKAILTLDGNCYFNTTKKAAVLVRTKVGAEINIKGNMDITTVVDDQVNHIWIDEGAKTKEDVEKITIKNARWKLEGATWSAENDANGNVVTAYADDSAGMNEALSYGMNTIVLADGTYTLPDMSDREISLSGGAGANISIADNHTNLTDCMVTLSGVTLSATNAEYGIRKATALICSGVTVKPIALYGLQAVFVGCTFDLTTSNGNGNYLRVKEVNTANFTKCVFNTNGKGILISNPSEENNYANNVTVMESEFYALGNKPAYSDGLLKTQACAAIEISNQHNSGVGAAHKLTTNGNIVGAAFSGEWRIKNYQEGAAVTVNGTEYTQIALDGKKMEVTDNGIIFID